MTSPIASRMTARSALVVAGLLAGAAISALAVPALAKSGDVVAAAPDAGGAQPAPIVSHAQIVGQASPAPRMMGKGGEGHAGDKEDGRESSHDDDGDE